MRTEKTIVREYLKGTPAFSYHTRDIIEITYDRYNNIVKRKEYTESDMDDWTFL